MAIIPKDINDTIRYFYLLQEGSSIEIGDFTGIVKKGPKEAPEMDFFKKGYTAFVCTGSPGRNGSVSDIEMYAYMPREYGAEDKLEKRLTDILIAAEILPENCNLYVRKEGDAYALSIFEGVKGDGWKYAEFSLTFNPSDVKVKGDYKIPLGSKDEYNMPILFEKRFAINELAGTGAILIGKTVQGKSATKEAELFTDQGFDFNALSEENQALATDYMSIGALIIPDPLMPKSRALVYHPSFSSWQKNA